MGAADRGLRENRMNSIKHDSSQLSESRSDFRGLTREDRGAAIGGISEGTVVCQTLRLQSDDYVYYKQPQKQ
jgi:hypothetical protein